jgi:hypothetical protein
MKKVNQWVSFKKRLIKSAEKPDVKALGFLISPGMVWPLGYKG